MLPARNKGRPIQGLNRPLEPVVVVHLIEQEIFEELLTDRTQGLEGDHRVIFTVVDHGRDGDRGMWIKPVLRKRQRWSEQNKLAHLFRMFAREECCHQTPEAGADDCPARLIPDDRIKLRHALLEGAGEVRRQDAGKDPAKEGALEALTTAYQSVQEDDWMFSCR